MPFPETTKFSDSYGLNDPEFFTNTSYHPIGIRLGGMLIDRPTANAWASKIAGRPIDQWTTVLSAIRQHALRHNIFFRSVGRDTVNGKFLLCTHSKPLPGWEDMDIPNQMPRFEADNPRSQVARRLLEDAGITDYKFVTLLD